MTAFAPCSAMLRPIYRNRTPYPQSRTPARVMPAIPHHVSHPPPAQAPVATPRAAPECPRPRESWCSNRRGIGPKLPLRPFFSHGSRRMLVCPDRRAIQHQTLQVRISKGLEHPLPNAAFRPAIESLKHGIPVAKTLRQVAPGAPVRAIQMTAFTNKRLSSAWAPGHPSRPGNSGSICRHCSSVSS